MLRLVTCVALLACGNVLSVAIASAQAPDPRPNILLIVADDLGYTDLGAFGGEIRTPHIDSLARAGIRLTNFHAASYCQQTRAMLMAGRGTADIIQLNPPRPDDERDNELRQEVATLPELLRAAGYRTYMSGKWDLGTATHATPAARGFDRSFALLEASSSHFAEYFWSDRSWYQEDDRPLAIDDLPVDFYSTTAYTDKLLQYLDEHDDESPWFGYLAYTAPHWPVQVPDEWHDRYAGRYDDGYDELREQRMRGAMEAGVLPPGLDAAEFVPTAPPWNDVDPELRRRYARAQEVYASMVEILDLEVGRIVASLDASGQLDDTLILFISDNGPSAEEIGIAPGPTTMPAHFNRAIDRQDNSLANIGRPGSFVDRGIGFGEAAAAPFKLYKSSLAEGGIRTAAFVHYPAVRQASIDNTFVTVMDILPTLLDVAGGSHPGAGRFNGRDVLPLAGRSAWPWLSGETGSVHGDEGSAGWKRGAAGALIRGRYKLTNHPPPGRPAPTEALPWRLYDLESDPGETTDIASRHAALVQSMVAEWERDWR